jgi:hypothetical protein
MEPKEFGSRRARSRDEKPTQRETGARQARPDYIFRDTYALGHFRRTQPIDFPQHEHLTSSIRKAIDCSFQHVAQFSCERLTFRAVSRRSRPNSLRFRHVVVEGFVPPVATNPREGFVDCDSREPRDEPSVATELTKVRVRIHVRPLHHVLSFRIIARNGARRAVEAFVVTPHQYLEERRLPAQDTRDDLLIAKRIPLFQNGGTDKVHVFPL